MDYFVAYILIGFFAGLAAGLLGVGGGIVVVPALIYTFSLGDILTGQATHIAIATSLAAMIFTTGSSVVAHHRKGAVLWSVVLRLAPGLAVGAAAGVVLVGQMSNQTLRNVLGVFELLVALQILLQHKPNVKRSLPGAVSLSLIGGGIGSVSSLVGVGGGTLVVPLLMYGGVSLRSCVATSSACALSIATAGVITFLALSVTSGVSSVGLVGFIYLPALVGIVLASLFSAPLGVKIVHTISTKWLKGIFALFLGSSGLFLILYSGQP